MDKLLRTATLREENLENRCAGFIPAFYATGSTPAAVVKGKVISGFIRGPYFYARKQAAEAMH